MLDCPPKTIIYLAITAAAALHPTVGTANTDERPPQFMGASSCQSSGCHGGAGPKRNQNIVWTKFDFHSRAYAILATSRSERIAETLKTGPATESGRCTVCHSPFQAVPAGQLAKTAHPEEGVSCESCHGASEGWLRSHTRNDYSHRDRINIGLRELKPLYSRANACVACHETIGPAILEAGHPKLIFELDSQLVSQPPHWQETDSWQGPRAWLTGQAVALREQSQSAAAVSTPRWKALVWLLRQVTQTGLTQLPGTEFDPRDNGKVQRWADELARIGAESKWSAQRCFELLRTIAGMEAAAGVEFPEQVSRAEVLAQALDRLTVALNKNGRPLPGAEPVLGLLFADVRDSHAFDPAQFSQHQKQFQRLLASTQPTP